ncbi:uncharacterized protein LOC126708323 [Quercus robur]|uniref:uncharacterized protein LOC126708323 n=1 Tax=Quercus robur TaxID=38942 RepID=UPI002161453A|nr:uncharacterized protein LOC126708323 [Quercus robur]
MSERNSGDHAGTGSVGFSQGSSWRERKQKERKDRGHDQQKVMSDIGKGSYQTQRMISSATGQRQKEERDKELEWLRRLVRGLELEVRGRRRRGDRNDRQQEVGIGGNRYEEGSNQSGPRLRRSRSHSREFLQYQNRSHSRGSQRNRSRSPSRESGQRQDRSHSRENQGRDSLSPKERQPRNAAMDAMSRALRKAARSPFSNEIERVEMLDRFACPPFNYYDGKIDPVEHINHYI